MKAWPINPINKLFYGKNKVDFIKPKKNVFNIENGYNSNVKHWAIILELSNDSYVNIQFGRNGFSLEEFNKTNIKGESVFNAILNTWGEKDDPFSFCYLGNANKEYDELKEYLKNKKNQEIEFFRKKNEAYYNVCFNNCQHFACEIEKFLFYKIKVFHLFDYYLDQFFEHFFSNFNIDNLKIKHESEINKKNEELFKLNIKEIQKKSDEIKEFLGIKKGNFRIKRLKIQLEKLYGLKWDDYLI